MKLGYITLLYKKNKGKFDELKNWRPISLLNLDYKILTKILTNRFKANANTIFNNLQSCCPGQTKITDNTLNLQHIINYIENEDKHGALVSLDQEKAFDRIAHNYIIQVLKKFKFPKFFIAFIKIISYDTSSQVIVNGTFTQKIILRDL